MIAGEMVFSINVFAGVGVYGQVFGLWSREPRRGGEMGLNRIGDFFGQDSRRIPKLVTAERL
jgi:hypothetical protein